MSQILARSVLAALLLCGSTGIAAVLPPPPERLDPLEATAWHRVIHFDPDRGRVRRGDEPGLEELALFLLGHPGLRIEIQGHTDPFGTAEFKLAEGEKYAATLMGRLKALGVPPARMETRSYGKERPLYRGRDRVEGRRNARCEFRLLRP
jgi:peptidoglycan-associated lipoprotein